MSLDLNTDVLGAFRFLIKLGDYGWIFGLMKLRESVCISNTPLLFSTLQTETRANFHFQSLLFGKALQPVSFSFEHV